MPSNNNHAPPESAVAAARSVHLQYITDSTLGIHRRGKPGRFTYVSARGEQVVDEAILRRIKSLVIPPAWIDVWICPLEKGHIQATGRDARGRKQYRYHPRWREIRDDTKYFRMQEFARALPKIRRQTAHDLRLSGLPRRKVLAAVVELLEQSQIRVGNEEYAHDNHSYGLTTLRNRHAKIHADTIEFHFRGKSGKEHAVKLRDARLARIVRACRDIPGQDLFQYLEDGERHHVRSHDVNDYIREIAGDEFSAKDFRTWAGTIFAGIALRECTHSNNQSDVKKNLIRVVESVAQRLGNTPAICKKSYIHPDILDGYLQGATIAAIDPGSRSRKNRFGLSADEASVIAYLKKCAAKRNEPLVKTLRRSIAAQAKRRPRKSL